MLVCTITIGLYGEQVVTAKKVDASPVIDGKLTDTAWLNAITYRDFTTAGGKSPARSTEVKIIYTETALVFGVKAFISSSELPRESELRKNRSPYHSDSIELMLDCSGSADHYLHVIVDSINSRYQAQREQGGMVAAADINVEWKSATYRDKDFWSAEISLPFYTLGLTAAEAALPGKWRFNIVRNTYRLPHVSHEISSLAEGKVHQPSLFPAMNKPSVSLNNYVWEINKPQTNERFATGQRYTTAKVSLKNQTGMLQSLKGELAFISPERKIILGKSTSLQLSAGSISSVCFDEFRLETPGNYQGIITFRELNSNRILARSYFTWVASFSPVEITLIDPHYRNAIFATQHLDKVRYTVSYKDKSQSNKFSLQSGIRTFPDKNVIVQKSLSGRAVGSFEFPTSSLPDGRLEIFVKLVTLKGEIFADYAVPIRKLPYQKNEIWRDR